MSEPLLRIQNHHVPGMGDPPILNNDDPNIYIGYFASDYGDQWVFTFDRTTSRGAAAVMPAGTESRVEDAASRRTSCCSTASCCGDGVLGGCGPSLAGKARW
jgi:hypothetical protein